jgi:hypothetical protein
MRRTYLCMLLSIFLPVFAVYAQPMRGGDRGQSSGHPMGGRASGSSFHHGAGQRPIGGRPSVFRGRGFDRGGFHGRGPRIIVYGYGWGVPYYYGSGYGYYNSQPYYACPAPADYSTDQDSPDGYYANQDTQGYYQVGNQWGAELQQYQLTMDQLVTYLRAYIINSSTVQQDAFRSGFIASAVPNASVMFDQAMQQAAPRS